MSALTVWDAARARSPERAAGPAAAELLELLGFDLPASPGSNRRPLGDNLATVIDALGVELEGDLLVSADVVERGTGNFAVGAVLSSGELDTLAIEVARAPTRLAIVADDSDPGASMAERLRARLDRSQGASVMGVLSLGEAADRVLGLRERALAGTLIPADLRRRAQERLFEQTLTASRLSMEWSLVCATALGLARHLEEGDDQGHFEVELVRDIARRHDGITAPILWPDPERLEGYPTGQRLRIVAHVVQSVADGERGAVPEYTAHARKLVGEERSAEALRLLGAVGRALAAVGQYEEAGKVLDDALAGFLQHDPAEASYTLCELLRIEGIKQREDRVLALCQTAERLVPAIGPESRPYVRLAAGRALAQVGHAREALEALSDEMLGAHAPLHVQTAAQRWRAIAATDAGEAVAAARALESLAHLGESDQLYLAQLDARPVGVLETKACLDGMLALPGAGDEARRIMSRLAPGLSTRAMAERPEVLRRIRAEYRY